MAIYIGYQKVTGSGGAGGGGEDPSVLMTQAEYDAAYAAGTLSANITYMTPDSGTGGGEIPVASQTAVGGVRVGFNGGSDPDVLGNFPVALSGPDAYVGLSALCEKIRKLENLVNGGGEMNLDSLTFDTSQVSVLHDIKYNNTPYSVPPGEYLCYPTLNVARRTDAGIPVLRIGTEHSSDANLYNHIMVPKFVSLYA